MTFHIILKLLLIFNSSKAFYNRSCVSFYSTMNCRPLKFDMFHQSTSQWNYPDNKVHGANMGPTWVLSAPDGPHVGPVILAIRVTLARDQRQVMNQCYEKPFYRGCHQFHRVVILHDESLTLRNNHMPASYQIRIAKYCPFHINLNIPLWSSDAISSHTIWSTLVQIMACPNIIVYYDKQMST